MNLLNNRTHSLRLLAIALSLFTFLNVSTVFAQGTWCYKDYTSNDNFTIPGGCTKVTIEAIGGGGGGGSAIEPDRPSWVPAYSLGGGGGGGAYALLQDYAITSGTLTITVGTGGGSDNPGTASTVEYGSTTLLTAGGGSKGESAKNGGGNGGNGGTYSATTGANGTQGDNATHVSAQAFNYHADENISGAGGSCGKMYGNNPIGGLLLCNELGGNGGVAITADDGWDSGNYGKNY